MRALIQRVSEASVTVDQKIIGEIASGLLVFVGVKEDDTEKDIDYLVKKMVNLRLFPGESTGFHSSVLEEKMDILVVSQFTLYANCKKGRRPDFNQAAKPEKAKVIYDEFVEKMRKTGLNVHTGQFQAHMQVSLVNEGPVTLLVES